MYDTDVVNLVDKNSNGEVDPLRYWFNRRRSHKQFAVAAAWIMALPMTSVASEALFSQSGLVINKKRCALTSENAALLTFLWANAEIEDFNKTTVADVKAVVKAQNQSQVGATSKAQAGPTSPLASHETASRP